jgi:hypothetical protein
MQVIRLPFLNTSLIPQVRFGARYPERIFVLDAFEPQDADKPPLTNLEQNILDEIAQLVLVHKASVERDAHIPPKYGSPCNVDPQLIELSQIYEAFDAKDNPGLRGMFRDWQRQKQITQALWKFKDLDYIRFSRSWQQTEFDRTRPKVLPPEHVVFYPTLKGLERNTAVLVDRVKPEPGQKGFEVPAT